MIPAGESKSSSRAIWRRNQRAHHGAQEAIIRSSRINGTTIANHITASPYLARDVMQELIHAEKIRVGEMVGSRKLKSRVEIFTTAKFGLRLRSFLSQSTFLGSLFGSAWPQGYSLRLRSQLSIVLNESRRRFGVRSPPRQPINLKVL